MVYYESFIKKTLAKGAMAFENILKKIVIIFLKIHLIIFRKLYLSLYAALIIILLNFLLISCNQEAPIVSQKCLSGISQAWWNQSQEKDPLFLIVKNKKWGFINRSGKIVIKPQFNYAQEFSENRASFKSSNGKWVFIDSTGKIVIKPQFDDVHLFYEQRAAVKISNHWVFIDLDGHFIAEPQFTKVSRFMEGRVAVNKNWKWSFIDRYGKFITELRFDNVQDFSEGLAAVSVYKNNQLKQWFIDLNGNFIIKLNNNITIENERTGFWNGRVPVYGDHPHRKLIVIGETFFPKRWGVIDKTGKLVTSLKYDYIGKFSECLASVQVGEKEGVIDVNGNFIVKAKFDEIEQFNEELARVRVNEKYQFINKEGQIIGNSFFYNASYIFLEGFAAVQINKNEKWGAIDRTGKLVISPISDKHFRFINGLAEVKAGDKWGYIDHTGNFVWPPTK